jgi:hypothetical protein
MDLKKTNLVGLTNRSVSLDKMGLRKMVLVGFTVLFGIMLFIWLIAPGVTPEDKKATGKSKRDLSISHTGTRLPREIAKLRLGDSKESVLAKYPALYDHEAHGATDLPNMQLEELLGEDCSLDGMSSRVALGFARNKLYVITCFIPHAEIGIAAATKFEEKYSRYRISDHPLRRTHESPDLYWCYSDKDTIWEIIDCRNIRLPLSGSMEPFCISIQDVPTYTDFLTTLDKVYKYRENNIRKWHQDLGEGLVK